MRQLLSGVFALGLVLVFQLPAGVEDVALRTGTLGRGEQSSDLATRRR